ncbi:MAG: recombinase family protein [Candidatus Helarchaeota archaeon]
MSVYLSISAAAHLLGVCTKTLRRWDHAALFRPTYRTPGGHRRYCLQTLRTFLAGREASAPSQPDRAAQSHRPPRAVIYGRVSSSRQKVRGDLERQLAELRQFCQTHRYQVVREFSDVASGLNDTRQGLHRLIRTVSRGYLSWGR